jgi:hypothetical protein
MTLREIAEAEETLVGGCGPALRPVDVRVTVSFECTPHQAERIAAFVRGMQEVAA